MSSRFFSGWFRIPGNVRYSLLVVGVLLILNFLLRLVFLYYNFSRAEHISIYYIFKALLIGLRFDLATIMIFNGIIFLFLSLPLAVNRSLRTFRIVNVLILLINIPILVVNTIDVVYFGFADKRITHELYTTNISRLNNSLVFVVYNSCVILLSANPK